MQACDGGPCFKIMNTSGEFLVGQKYSIQHIQEMLDVGNAGGIRACIRDKTVRRVVVLTAAATAKLHRENPYHDRIEGDVLVYSAGGLDGDQTLAGVNKRLVEQSLSLFPIYGFRLNESRRKAGPERWEFIGLLQFLRVYPDSQVDRNGQMRRVWLVELRVCREPERVVTSCELEAMSQAVRSFDFDAAGERRAEVAVEAETAIQPMVDHEAVEAVRASIFRLDPRAFETLVKRAVEQSGFVDVTVTRYTQDEGIDVDARMGPGAWPVSGLRVQLQAKRWLHTVGRREIAELRGSLAPFAQGAVVTTSYFSRAAIAEAAAPGRQPIRLVDGYQFARTVHEKGLCPQVEGK